MNATCYGSVRGCCGHVHRSWDAAQRCVERDQRGCQSQGGYSDRHVITTVTRPEVRAALGYRVARALGAYAELSVGYADEIGGAA